MNFQYPLKGHQFLRAPVERGQVRDSQAYHPGGLLQGIKPNKSNPQALDQWMSPRKKHQKKQVEQ